MLSINIPVYNIEVTNLVTQLINQAKMLEIEYEIRVYDDKSNVETKRENRKIKSLPNIIYKELRKNIGRAAIRNKMGFESKYQYLLFIDADSKLISENFLSAYLRYAPSGNVMCGGTVYDSRKPKNPEKLLRWYYGTHREAISAQQKNRSKGFIIDSKNFLLGKNVFEKIHFREDLKQYGHEDTLIGFDLYKNGIKIVHFDNPVEHTGLENSNIFLKKTRLALENLQFICDELIDNNNDFISQINFLRKYHKLNKILPNLLLVFIYQNLRKRIEKNLSGKNPKLFLFDIYKVGYFATIKNRGKKTLPQ